MNRVRRPAIIAVRSSTRIAAKRERAGSLGNAVAVALLSPPMRRCAARSLSTRDRAGHLRTRRVDTTFRAFVANATSTHPSSTVHNAMTSRRRVRRTSPSRVLTSRLGSNGSATLRSRVPRLDCSSGRSEDRIDQIFHGRQAFHEIDCATGVCHSPHTFNVTIDRVRQ